MRQVSRPTNAGSANHSSLTSSTIKNLGCAKGTVKLDAQWPIEREISHAATAQIPHNRRIFARRLPHAAHQSARAFARHLAGRLDAALWQARSVTSASDRSEETDKIPQIGQIRAPELDKTEIAGIRKAVRIGAWVDGAMIRSNLAFVVLFEGPHCSAMSAKQFQASRWPCWDS